MKALSTLSYFLSLSLSLSHSLSIFLSHSRAREERVSPVSREAANPPRDNHASPPEFRFKIFFHGFIQKYIYTYTVGVYVTLSTSLQRTSPRIRAADSHRQTGLTDPWRVDHRTRVSFFSNVLAFFPLRAIFINSTKKENSVCHRAG